MSILNIEKTKNNTHPKGSDIKIIFFSSYLHVYIIHFQNEDFWLNITLKVRVFATEKNKTKQNKKKVSCPY